MGINSNDLDEYGHAKCTVCRKNFTLADLEDKCEFCNKWFCKKCSKPTPPGHGYGKICKNCYVRIRKIDKA